METTNRKSPELLAPAGSPDAVRAAVSSGADAVYLGLEELNARQGAQNFDLESLREAIGLTHVHGVKVYLALNVVIHQDEMVTALDLADQAWTAGVDAIIVQDLGLAGLIKSELPGVRLHASTQVNTHNTLTVEALSGMGFARVTLARELSLGEISRITRSSNVEIEVFAHGALCVCYSGQCLMSSVIGGRSANRGRCAQPCRLTYELFNAKNRKVSKVGPHLLSTKDVWTIGMLPELIASGIHSLKIEGRMKSPEYVALVTGVYRAALDRAWHDPESYSVTEAETGILAEAFSRGFTSGYLTKIRGQELMSHSRPNNRGIPVGRVAKAGAAEVKVKLDVGLDKADVIEFWTKAGRHTQPVGQMKVDGRVVGAAPGGVQVEIAAPGSVAVGDRVFRVMNAALNAAARRTFSKDSARAIAVDFLVSVVIGEPFTIEARVPGHTAAAFGDIVESARTKPITVKEITEHVGRLGGSGFRIGSMDVRLSSQAGLGFSAIHRLRKEVLKSLEESILSEWASRQSSYPKLPRLPGVRPRKDLPEIVVRCPGVSMAKACVAAGAHRAIVPIDMIGDPISSHLNIVPELPRIVHDAQVSALLRKASDHLRVYTGNLGLLPRLASEGVAPEADWSLNVTNAWTIAALGKLGTSFVWLSPELSGRQTSGIAQFAKTPVGIAVYGRQEVMVLEHCVLTSTGPCDQKCPTCTRRTMHHVLRDAKGYAFPVAVDLNGRTHVYNSATLDLARAFPEIVGLGIDAVRLDFTVETLQQAQRITASVKHGLIEAYSKSTRASAMTPPSLTKTPTSGLFYRGVK